MWESDDELDEFLADLYASRRALPLTQPMIPGMDPNRNMSPSPTTSTYVHT